MTERIIVTKDPESIEWMPAIPWETRLGGVSEITASAWIVEAGSGLTVADEESDETNARVMLSGGTVRKNPWIVTNRVTTDAGEVIDWSFRVRVAVVPVRIRTKDPDSTEVLAVNWARKLGALTIASSEFAVASGITKLFQSLDGQRALVKLTGATLGNEYDVKNTIVTSDEQTLVYRFVIRCVHV